MNNPLEPKVPDTSYQLIATEVKKLATKDGMPGKETAAEAVIMANLTRPGGPDVDHISFVEECSLTDKVIVVPPLDVIETGAGKPYRLTDIYRDKFAEQLLNNFDAEGRDPSTLYQYMDDFRRQAISEEEFHKYRLGEYCINQCM